MVVLSPAAAIVIAMIFAVASPAAFANRNMSSSSRAHLVTD